MNVLKLCEESHVSCLIWIGGYRGQEVSIFGICDGQSSDGIRHASSMKKIIDAIVDHLNGGNNDRQILSPKC